MRTAQFGALWWILAGGHITSWVIGMPAVIGATLVSLWLRPAAPGRWRLSGLVSFLHFFLVQSVRGSIDVAARALHPRLPLNPGLMSYIWRLPEGPARIFLANTVSLLPGTLIADVSQRGLILHVLDIELPILAQLQVLESRVAVLFGLSLMHEESADG